jgi:hypothetical protein
VIADVSKESGMGSTVRIELTQARGWTTTFWAAHSETKNPPSEAQAGTDQTHVSG